MSLSDDIPRTGHDGVCRGCRLRGQPVDGELYRGDLVRSWGGTGEPPACQASTKRAPCACRPSPVGWRVPRGARATMASSKRRSCHLHAAPRKCRVGVAGVSVRMASEGATRGCSLSDSARALSSAPPVRRLCDGVPERSVRMACEGDSRGLSSAAAHVTWRERAW